MNILICTPEYPPLYSSGIGNVVESLKNEISVLDVNCTVCSTICSDIELCNRGFIKNFVKIRSIYVSYYWLLAKRYINKHGHNFDIIWVHDPLPHFFWGLPRNNRIIITFHTIHSFYLYYSRYPKILLYILRNLETIELNKIKYNTTIVAVNGKVIDELSQLGLEREKVKLISNGVNTDLYKPAQNKKLLRDKLDLPKNEIILLSVGKIKEQKQPFKLIELFCNIEKSLENVTLLVIGTGHLLEKAKEFAKDRNSKKIIFKGYVPDTKDYYACADYYIMTSQYEGLPLTLLEAMSSGLPCIVSNIPNLKIVLDAQCGIAVDFGDVDSATNDVLSYLKRDNRDHSINARNYSVSNLDWMSISRKYYSLFNSLLE